MVNLTKTLLLLILVFAYSLVYAAPTLKKNIFEFNTKLAIQEEFSILTDDTVADPNYPLSQLRVQLKSHKTYQQIEFYDKVYTTFGQAVAYNTLDPRWSQYKGKLLYYTSESDGTNKLEVIPFRVINPDGEMSDWGEVRISLDGQFDQNYDYQPVADNVSTDIDTSVIVNVLANDPAPQTYYKVEIYQNPSNGSLTISDDERYFSYIPDSGFTGTDSFQYSVVGNNLYDIYSAPATVTISVLAEPELSPEIVVKQFEWIPNTIAVGESATLHWQIENAESCFDESKTYSPSGTSPNQQFTEPQTVVTQWYCLNKDGSRFPSDSEQFIETTVSVAQPPQLTQKIYEFNSRRAIQEEFRILSDATVFDPNYDLNELRIQLNSDKTYDQLGFFDKIRTTFGQAVAYNTLDRRWFEFKGKLLYHTAEADVKDKKEIIPFRVINPDGHMSEWGEIRIGLDGQYDQNFDYYPTADNVNTDVNKSVVINALANDPEVQWYYNIETYLNPSHGSLAVSDDKQHFIYTPNPGFIGIDSFQYSVIGNNLYEVYSAPTTVTINVAATTEPEPSPSMSEAQFEWNPSSIIVGESATLHWQIDNAESCFEGDKIYSATGAQPSEQFTQPKAHITQWYCLDKDGKRLPSDENKFLETPITILADSPTEQLISHGDFELGNDFTSNNTKVSASLTKDSPITGQQSLLLEYTDNTSIRFYNTFTEKKHVKNVHLTGFLKMLPGAETESVWVYLQVNYEKDGQWHYTYLRKKFNANNSHLLPISIDLPVNEMRQAKNVMVSISYKKNEKNLALLLDNLQLHTEYAQTASQVFSGSSNKLYVVITEFGLPRYLEVSQSTSGLWTVVELTKTAWEAVHSSMIATDYHIEFGAFGQGDSQGFTLTTSQNSDDIIIQHNKGSYQYVQPLPPVPARTPSSFQLRCNLNSKNVLCAIPPLGEVTLAWKPPAEGEVVEYQVMGELKNIIEQRPFTPDADGYFTLTRPALTEGREYCYKVKAIFDDGSTGEFTNKQCKVIGQLAFNEPTALSIEKIAAQQFSISWSPVSGASKYLLEQQISPAQWQAVQYTASTSKSQTYTSHQQAIYSSLGHMAYRVSACNKDNICGNYKRVYYRELEDADFVQAPPASHKAPACLRVPEQVNEGEPIQVSWCPTQAPGVQHYEFLGELKGVLSTITPSEFNYDKQGLLTLERPPLAAGREYCYKVRAIFTSGEEGGYIDKQCVTVGYTAFPATEAFISVPVDEASGQYDLLWLPIENADSYHLERRASVDVWQTYECDVTSLTYDNKLYQGCRVNLTQDDIIEEFNNVLFRVSACDANGVCGNYERTRVTLFSPEGDVYVQVPDDLGGQYLKITKADGEWLVEELTQSQWDSEAQPNPDTGFNSQHLKLYQVEDTWHIEEITQLEWDELTL